MPYGKLSYTSKQVKKGIGGYFYRIRIIGLALNEQKLALPFFLPYGKHGSTSKQVKQGVVVYFCQKVLKTYFCIGIIVLKQAKVGVADFLCRMGRKDSSTSEQVKQGVGG